MNPISKLVARVRRRGGDSGLTLVELMISIVILGLVTSATVVALYSSLSSSNHITQRLRESNDAQIISAWLVRDAQAAGGTNPTSGAVDSTLGVTLNSGGGCATAGTPVVSFRWVDRTATTADTKVSAYSTDGTNLVRSQCVNGGAASVATLGQHVASATASCAPAANCPGLPTSVTVTITEAADSVTPTATFTYDLTASLRPDAHGLPTASNNLPVPLLALGASTCAGGDATGVAVTGSGSVAISGAAIINSSGISGCPAMHMQGGNNTEFAAGSLSILSPGVCNAQGGVTCPTPIPMATPLVDPLAGLLVPAVNCGGSNPATLNGAPLTVHPVDTTLSGAIANGVHVFCGNLTLGNTSTSVGGGALLYMPTGTVNVTGDATIEPMTAGPWANVAFWKAVGNTTAMSMNGGESISSTRGIFYAPSTVLSVSGGSDVSVQALIVQALLVGGNGTNVVLGSGTPVPVTTTTAPGPATTTTTVPGPTTTTTAPPPTTTVPPLTINDQGNITVARQTNFTVLIGFAGGASPYTCSIASTRLTGSGNDNVSNLACAIVGSNVRVTGRTANKTESFTLTVAVFDSGGRSATDSFMLASP